jgi:hypothetical protein
VPLPPRRDGHRPQRQPGLPTDHDPAEHRERDQLAVLLRDDGKLRKPGVSRPQRRDQPRLGLTSERRFQETANTIGILGLLDPHLAHVATLQKRPVHNSPGMLSRIRV